MTAAEIIPTTSGKFQKVYSNLIDSSDNVISSDNPLPIIDFSKLVPTTFDYIKLTYVSGGNGDGEIETVTYRTGGSSGTIQAVLTLTYDANDNIDDITKSDS